MRLPTTRRIREAGIDEATRLIGADPEEDRGLAFVAASVPSSKLARKVVGTPAFLVTAAAILLFWGAGTFPRGWIGLAILLAWEAAWKWFRMRRTCIVHVLDERVAVIQASPVGYRPMRVLLDEARPGPTLTLGPPRAFDVWFSIRGSTGRPMTFVTGQLNLSIVRWAASMTTDGLAGADAEAEYRTARLMSFVNGPRSSAGIREEIKGRRTRRLRRIGGGVLLGLGSAIAVISALLGGPPSFLGSSWMLTSVVVIGTSVGGTALIRWNQGGASLSDQWARVVASISIVALCVGIGGEIFRHPTPMVAVGNAGTVTVVAAACGFDELQSISVVRPADPTVGRPREVLWAISDPTPDREVHIFDVGVAWEGYITDVELAGAMSPSEPLVVEVDTRRSSTSLPFVFGDLERGAFLTPTGTVTFEDLFGFTELQLFSHPETLQAPEPRC